MAAIIAVCRIDVHVHARAPVRASLAVVANIDYMCVNVMKVARLPFWQLLVGAWVNAATRVFHFTPQILAATGCLPVISTRRP